MTARTWRDPRTKNFEDFAVGDVMITRGRTIDIGDLTTFAGLTGNYYQLHTDEAFARTTYFGTRVTHGSLTYSIAVGLVGMSDFYGDAIVALLEVRAIRATKPVLPGDTIKVRATVAECTPGSNLKYGTIGVQYSVRNQKDEEVMNFLQIMLARRQESRQVSEQTRTP